jgi:hypothetical protein
LTLSRYRQARSNVSCTASSASGKEPSDAVTVDKQFVAMTLDIATELV